MKKILLIGDCERTAKLIQSALRPLIEVNVAQCTDETSDLLDKKHFDLFLIDLDHLNREGASYCSDLKASVPGKPIFCLSSKNDLSKKVLCFSAGADDYITRPFEPLEMKARIEARLRSLDEKAEESTHISHRKIEIDILSQDVWVREKDGRFKNVDLTGLEFKMLVYLSSHVNHVLSRDKIIHELWGGDISIHSRSVDTHISNLRKKLGPASDTINSVHGAGYRFSPSQAN